MKNITAAIWGLLFSVTAMAQLPTAKLPALQHLEAINAEWKYYQDLAPVHNVAFNTDNERIQLHLQLVVRALRKKNTALNPEQEQQRRRLLDTLEVYAAKRTFPINQFHKERTPYFIDHNNTHCAVGYLMKASGNGELALAISAAHNYDYVADIRTEGLLEWAQEHGFETSELAWIQPSYPDSRRTVSIGGGVNGEVNNLEEVYIKGQTGLVATGSFDSIGGTYCEGVGFYADGKWHCLGSGISGSTEYINTRGTGELILCGNFLHNGKQYPAAVLDSNGNWAYPEKPKGADMVGTTYIYYWAEFMTYYFPEDDHSELWRKDDEEGFIHLLDIKGRVNDVSSFEKTVHGELDFVLVFGGAFKEIRTSGSDQWMTSNSLFFLDLKVFGLPDIIPVKEMVQDTVLTLEGSYKVMYIGGTCQSATGDYRSNCITKLVDSNFIPIVSLNGANPPLKRCPCKVSGLAFSNNGTLIFGGTFETSEREALTFSNGLAEYDPLRELTGSYRNVDGYLNTVTRLHDGHVAFGGSFQRGNSYSTRSWLRNLGRTYDEVGIEEPTSGLAIYPNPATDLLHIELNDHQQVEQIRFITSNGVETLAEKGHSQSSVQLSVQDLSPGMYIAEVRTVKGQVITQKFFVR